MIRVKNTVVLTVSWVDESEMERARPTGGKIKSWRNEGHQFSRITMTFRMRSFYVLFP